MGIDWRPLAAGMAIRWRMVLPVLLVVPLLTIGLPALAQPNPGPAPAATEGLTPEQARQAADLLRDQTRLRDVIAALDAVARLAPPQAATAPAIGQPGAPKADQDGTAAPAPAAPPAAEAAPDEPADAPAQPNPVSLASDGVLAQLIQALSAWLKTMAAQLATAGRALANIPLVWDWIRRTASSPAAQSAVLDAGWKLALVLLLAWGTQWLARRALRHPQRLVEARARAGIERRRAMRRENGGAGEGVIASRGELRFLYRAPLALLRLVLDLVPIGVFAAVGNLLLATPINEGWAPRLIILAAVNAYVVQHIVMAVGSALVSPDRPVLRLFDITDETAAYIEVWLRRISSVVIYGMAVLEIARILGLYYLAYDSMAKLVILVNHLLLAVVVLQSRKAVAARIAAPPGSRSAFALARNWLAAIWHVLAICFLFALWFVWALEIRNGYGLLFRYFGTTLIVLAVARLASVTILGMLDRIFRLPPEKTAQLPFLEARANRYYPVLRRFVSVLLGIVSVLAVLQVWGVDAIAWFQDGRLGERLAGSALVIVIAVLIAVVIWEGSTAWMDRQIADMATKGDYARSARLRTLLPLLRTALLTAILIVVGFTALSQLGVNIAPLLAGASIIGVALGFGSQKLVQDVITGMFLLLENTMQVGDWVTVSGLSGSVEALSVRTIKLRAGDGSVHVIPFSAVTTVTNTNRGIGNAAVSVTVAYDEDTDRVGEVLKQIGAELRQDPAFSRNILDDFALWGVDKVDGATATVLGQMKCTDTGRWGVQREFNRRIKRRFRELGIQIALPAQTIVLSRPHRQASVRVRPPRERMEAGSGAETRSPPPAALGNTA